MRFERVETCCKANERKASRKHCRPKYRTCYLSAANRVIGKFFCVGPMAGSLVSPSGAKPGISCGSDCHRGEFTHFSSVDEAVALHLVQQPLPAESERAGSTLIVACMLESLGDHLALELFGRSLEAGGGNKRRGSCRDQGLP